VLLVMDLFDGGESPGTATHFRDSLGSTIPGMAVISHDQG